MPRTRRMSEEDNSNNGVGAGAADAAAVNNNITLSQETLTSLLTSIQQSQNEFCQQLIREVRSSTPQANNNNMSEYLSCSTHSMMNGNFAKCLSRYGGRPEESLDNFIDAVITYKECVNASDENALRGFSMLLEGPAAVWWQGIKRSTVCWSEALTRIKSAFGDHDPPFRVYKQLFNLSQDLEHTDLFIAKVHATPKVPYYRGLVRGRC